MRLAHRKRVLWLLSVATLALVGEPANADPVVRSWGKAGDGDWFLNTNWVPAIVPNGANIEADFKTQANFKGKIKVTLDQPVTLNKMLFNSANAYTITPQANQAITLTNFNDKGTDRLPQIIVAKGNTANETVVAPIVLAIPNTKDLYVRVVGSPSSPSLTLSGVISNTAGQTNGIAKAGTGTLLLGAANTYTGNTSIYNGNVIAAVNGALGPGGANGGTVQVHRGASLTLGNGGKLDYNTGQKVVLQGNGVSVNGSPIGALTVNRGTTATFNGPITLFSKSVIGNAAIGAPGNGPNNLDPQLTITGQVSGAGNLNKVGDGVVQLATANSYTGKTDIQAGVLSVSANGALGKDDTTVEQGATLNLSKVDYIAQGNQAKANVILMGGLGNGDNGQIRADGAGAKSSFNGTITLAAGSSIGVYNGDTVLDFSGTIKETAKSDLTKLGPGQLVLESASTYTGGTLIKQGTLVANNGQNNGSATGSGDVTVAAGANLNAANGHIDGKVINQKQGKVAPKQGMNGGLLSISGGLAVAAGSTYEWTLGAQVDGRSPLARAGTDFSVLQLQGGLLSLEPGAILSLNLAGPGTIPTLSDTFWSTEHEWDIIALDSPSINPSSLAFTDIENGSYAAGSFSTTVDDGQHGYGNAGDILLVWSPAAGAAVVPEPTSWSLFLIGTGLIGLTAWQRRRSGALACRSRPATGPSRY
jgi:autotransporter-associated beta strand protein